MKMICFPHAGGTASSYNIFKKQFGDKLDFYAYEYNGRGRKQNKKDYTDFQNALNEIVSDLMEHQLSDHEPYCIFGHSMGAYIAIEVSYMLHYLYNYPPRVIFISGQSSPYQIRNDYVNVDDDELLWYIKTLGGTDSVILNDSCFRDMILSALRKDLKLLATYKPVVKSMKLRSDLYLMYGNEDGEINEQEMNDWGKLVNGQFERKQFSGGHFYLMDDPINITSYILEKIVLEGVCK
jgi:pyochelin biosynthetic protein PchC